MNRRPMMYHGSYQFGKAYQEEMRRIAGVDDEQENEIRGRDALRNRGCLVDYPAGKRKPGQTPPPFGFPTDLRMNLRWVERVHCQAC
jgi:hypothetical protein